MTPASRKGDRNVDFLPSVWFFVNFSLYDKTQYDAKKVFYTKNGNLKVLGRRVTDGTKTPDFSRNDVFRFNGFYQKNA